MTAKTMTPIDAAKDAADESLRFEFGRNWAAFLRTVGEPQIAEAVKSLRAMLRVEDLAGKRFLDAGSGSGLFSLAARRLGARVHSFDYDQQSVACTATLRERYCKDDPEWTVEQGSVLDAAYLQRLGTFDVVYSWGVLHHTGDMWTAMERVAGCVAPGGTLLIAIYNDQGGYSRRWLKLKKLYNRLPRAVRPVLVGAVVVKQWGIRSVRDLVYLHPFETWRNYGKERGMSPLWDVVDWVGGYPFEVARPEEVFEFYRDRGFELERLCTVGGGLGCNQFVFRRLPPAPSA